MRETTLYEPIKQHLERQDFVVKAEVGAADVVGVRGDEPPVIVELKTGFSLSLFHQAAERQSITDFVYIAVPAGQGKRFTKALQKNKRLCRRLGLGLITVRPGDQQVVVHLDPAPYKPRQSKPKKIRLLAEFHRRAGDPNVGGTRGTLMTSYRQDAIRCAQFLTENGATKASLVAAGSGVVKARQIMSDNHYGWFKRVEKGIYGVNPDAKDELSAIVSK